MNFPRPVFFICATLCAFTQAQEPPSKSSLNFTKDSNAVVMLQKAVGSMSPELVTDATASGTIVIVAGSDNDKGTIKISTLGTDRSLEQIQTAERNQTTVFSTVRSRITDGNSSQSLPLEITVTAQTPYFTWPLISAALNNPDTAFQYVGVEDLDGRSSHHIRFWNTYTSRPDFQDMAPFTFRDVWIDAVSYLPRKLSYEYREGGGSTPRIPVTVYYSDYRNIAGVQYPFLVEKSFNGTPWATISIERVSFNTGLSDSDFSVE